MIDLDAYGAMACIQKLKASLLMADEKTHNRVALESVTKSIEALLLPILPDSKILFYREIEESDTDGWYAVLGEVDGYNSMQSQIWLDSFSGKLRFQACFSGRKQEIKKLVKSVDKERCPILVLEDRDIMGIRPKTYNGDSITVLRKPLQETEFTLPIHEQYETDEEYYFGIYNRQSGTSLNAMQEFIAMAAAFFEDVYTALSETAPIDNVADVYSVCENKTKVVMHVKRERSKYLASQCKLRDGYVCQVCHFKFSEKYGKYGEKFAEAHHKLALSKRVGEVDNTIDDLITVCSNCHRMLHLMSGEESDIEELKKIVKRHSSD